MDAELIIVDKIENALAICERGQELIELPLERIEGAVKEGDILLTLPEGRYAVDAAATEQRRAMLTRRFAALRRR